MVAAQLDLAMIARMVQVGVVALWLTMTVWLVRTTWFPDESRFEDVELREVMNAMFENWNERAELVLLENGSEVGRMSVSATHARDEDEDVAIEDRRHRLSSEGSLSEFGVLEFTERGGGKSGQLSEVNAKRDKFMWQTVVKMDEGFAFASVRTVLRFPEHSAKLEVNYVKATDEIAVTALLKGIPAVQYEGKLSELRSSIPGGGTGLGTGLGMGLGLPMPFSSLAPEGTPGAGADVEGGDALLSSLSQRIPELLSGNPDKDTKEKLAAMLPRLSAKFGRTKIAGESMAVYLLLVTVGSEDDNGGKSDGMEKAIRLYIGEDGRPVLIDTPFGFEAIAEVMIPDPSEKDERSGTPEVIGRVP